MDEMLYTTIIFITIAFAYSADEPDLPLCPTGISFMPQSLPMHCRMPVVPQSAINMTGFDFLQGSPSDKSQLQIPPVSAPFLPPGYPMPPFPPMHGAMPSLMPGSMPGLIPGSMPGPMLGPMSMMGPPPPASKLPVVVMPYYKPAKSSDLQQSKTEITRSVIKKSHKKKRHRDCNSDESGCDSDDDTWSGKWKGARRSGSMSKNSGHKHHRHESDDFEHHDDHDHDSDEDNSHDHEHDYDKDHDHGHKRYWESHESGEHGLHETGHVFASVRGRGDDGSEFYGGRLSRRFSRKKGQNRNEILTPLIQYVTKDGFVIFEKEISRGEAKDWLDSGNKNVENTDNIEINLTNPPAGDIQATKANNNETNEQEEPTQKSTKKHSGKGKFKLKHKKQNETEVL